MTVEYRESIIVIVNKEAGMKKYLYVTMALILFLVGCSEKGNSEDDSRSSTKSLSPVVFWSTDSQGARRELIDTNIAIFESQYESIDILPEYYDDESYKTKIKVAVAGNEMPDVFGYWIGGQFKTLVDAHVVADITEKVNENPEFKESFLPGAFEAVTYDGRIYGLPTTVGSVVIWYNKEIFSQYNVSEPQSWDDLLEAVKVFNSNNVIPITVAGKDRWPLLHWFSYLSQRVGGVEPFNRVVDGTGDFTHPSFVKAAELLQDLVLARGFINGFLGLDYGAAEAQFTAGNAAMYMQGDWSLSSFTQDATFSEKIGFFAFPEIPNGAGNPQVFHGGFGNATVIAKDADIDAAFTFATYLSSPEYLKSTVEQRGTPSPVRVTVDPNNMDSLVYDYVSYFSTEPEGFFGYYDQQLDPKKSEKILNAIQAITAKPESDVLLELSKVK